MTPLAAWWMLLNANSQKLAQTLILVQQRWKELAFNNALHILLIPQKTVAESSVVIITKTTPNIHFPLFWLLFRKSRFGIIGKRNWTDEDKDEFNINKTHNNPHIYIQLEVHNLIWNVWISQNNYLKKVILNLIFQNY